MDTFKIIVIIFMMIVIYQIYQINCTVYKDTEGFEGATQSLGGVDDANSINTLAQIAKKLMGGSLTVPGSLTIQDNLSLSGLATPVTIFKGSASPDNTKIQFGDGSGWRLRFQKDDSRPAMDIYDNGNVNVFGAFNLLPRGIIVSFNGTAAPAGWALCDGGNGTPNLKDRFIVGAGGGYGLGAAGGNAVIQLNATQIPPHRHHTAVSPPHWGWGDGYLGNGNNGFSGGGGARFGTGGEPFQTGDGNGGQSGCAAAGIDIRPPFYALCYIMKL